MIGKKFIVFDIGKTKILAAVIKIHEDAYDILGIGECRNPRNSKKIEKIVLDFCQMARKKYWTKKVAISAAHLVDPQNIIVRQGKACYGADVFGFQFLRQKGFLVKIENDGRCFAMGECIFGKGKSAANLLTLALGTGIGGGYILNGKNYQGAHNSSLEVSHISVNYLNRWQDWAGACSGKGIENIYRRKTGKKRAAKEIFLEARKNNQIAKEVIWSAADVLGMGTASLIDILDPELIIFGGSLSKEKKFVQQAIKVARKNVFNKYANYKFAISTLGNKANLLGAASLYL